MKGVIFDWDGVVIDFEQVDRVDQPGLVDLLTRLRAALPVGSRLMAAVPVAQADKALYRSKILFHPPSIQLKNYSNGRSLSPEYQQDILRSIK